MRGLGPHPEGQTVTNDRGDVEPGVTFLDPIRFEITTRDGGLAIVNEDLLADVEGVGGATLGKLTEAGLRTVQQLQEAGPDVIGALGITGRPAAALQAALQALSSEPEEVRDGE
jgi:hypothetical protein